MPERHHVSWALELHDCLYWFDAGETCSHTGYLLGLKPTNVRAIFISHAHIDHVSGLPELIWCMRKLDARRVASMEGKTVDVFMPNPRLWPAMLELMKEMENGFKINFTLNDQLIQPGVVFDDGDVQVEALRNGHIASRESFSFRIKSQGKTIVFSGDVKSVTEMAEWLDEGCDLFLMETGHHKVADICEYVKARPQIKKLVFIHHGREILEHYDDALQTAQNILGMDGRVEIGYDRQIIEFKA